LPGKAASGVLNNRPVHDKILFFERGALAMSKISVGLCGLGRSGLGIHYAAIKERLGDCFQITAVADMNEELAAQKAAELGAKKYTDPARLFNDDSVELVVICTLSLDHPGHAIAAMRAGKHVLIEKPMAVTYTEAARIVETAHQTGRKATVFHNRRLDPDFVQIRQLQADGQLGKPFSIASFLHDYSVRNDWQIHSKFGGGYLNNWGPHLLDQALVLGDHRPVSVFANLQQRINPGDVEDHFKVGIEFEENLTATVEYSAAALCRLPRWQILCDKSAVLFPDGTAGILYERKGNDTVETRIPVSGDFHGQTAAFYRKLHDHLRNGAPAFVTPEQAAMVVRVIEAAKQSHREGRSINVK
jgi:scyllo-inositol 2-dehydrogenase (NADP+)